MSNVIDARHRFRDKKKKEVAIFTTEKDALEKIRQYLIFNESDEALMNDFLRRGKDE